MQRKRRLQEQVSYLENSCTTLGEGGTIAWDSKEEGTHNVLLSARRWSLQKSMSMEEIQG